MQPRLLYVFILKHLITVELLPQYSLVHIVVWLLLLAPTYKYPHTVGFTLQLSVCWPTPSSNYPQHTEVLYYSLPL